MKLKNENLNETQNPQLNIGVVIKSVCQHEWKIISYFSTSCSWTCKKCGKTVL